MFTERVKSSFATNEPIYTEEIIGLFPDYSRPQIFRFIREAEEKKEIVNFAKGIYYMLDDYVNNDEVALHSRLDKMYDKYINNTDISAGETPDILDACPTD